MSGMRRTKYHVRRRMFLNRDPDLPAFIIGLVEDTAGISDADEKQAWKYGDIVLEMGDCSRRVSFDFRMDTVRARSNSLYKIRRLAEVINAVRDAIETEADSIRKRPRTKTKTKK